MAKEGGGGGPGAAGGGGRKLVAGKWDGEEGGTHLGPCIRPCFFIYETSKSNLSSDRHSDMTTFFYKSRATDL